MPHQEFWLDSKLISFGKSGHTFEPAGGCFSAALAAARQLLSVGRLCICCDHSLIISEDHFVGRLAYHVLRHDGYLPAAARRVNNERRHGKSCRVPPQPFDDLNAFCHRSPEMLYAHRKVALIDVIRPYPVHHQFVHELSHYIDAVVYSAQQDRLIVHRYARISYPSASLCCLRRYLIRVIELHV